MKLSLTDEVQKEWQTLNHWSYSAPASLRVGLCAVITLYEFLSVLGNIEKTVGASGNHCICSAGGVFGFNVRPDAAYNPHLPNARPNCLTTCLPE